MSGFYRIQKSNYEKEEPLFLKKREDSANFLSADIKWTFYKNTRSGIEAALGLSNLLIINNSNIDIYEYKKNKTAVYAKITF